MDNRINKRNYYRILHVQPDAPVEIVKASYHTLMHRLKMHPDLGGDHWNAALLNEAMAVIGSASQRAEYDRELLERFGRTGMTGVYGVGLGGPDTVHGAESGDTAPERPVAVAPVTEYSPVITAYCPFCKTPHLPGIQKRQDAVCMGCGSPLTPASSGEEPVSGRRSLERMPRNGPVIYFTDWPQERGFAGRILDLSLQGLSFLVHQRIDTGEYLKLDCAVCKGIARVVRCLPLSGARDRGWSIGAEFVTLNFGDPVGSFISEIA